MSSPLRTADFDFELPPELIAQTPAPERDQARLLIAHRTTQTIEHRQFADLPTVVRAGDILVLNDSRVIPARLRGRNAKTLGQFEILLLEETETNSWWTMLRPGKRATKETKIAILSVNKNETAITATVEEVAADGRRRLRFHGVNNILNELDALGETPLPPYIHRAARQAEDRERYQTVYARPPGSVAAPTAGLHFTEGMLARLRALGVQICFVTLHVGAGTFAPVKADLLADHRMHSERYEISAETARAIMEGKSRGARIVAVGTTTLRVLESVAGKNSGAIVPSIGATDIFIYPPFKFKIVDALLTNFHLPRSTLLMLVSAFAAPGANRGREFILTAYRAAVAERYRFFSYGDAMLLL
jgi:S-adenosylmethionine:tRNA ribosyltransferase-isomerase